MPCMYLLILHKSNSRTYEENLCTLYSLFLLTQGSAETKPVLRTSFLNNIVLVEYTVLLCNIMHPQLLHERHA